ncbi:MAG TPA: VWA domain-containing protein [Gaiellaceae bacterium]|jgi:Ca-activated chloride channel family protein|nr:VWA domain-containing protein [Gaiellaceae bacterium]
MSFASPFVLWGLLLIPVGLLAYWLIQRRRIKYAARFTNLDLLANVVDASPGRRRHIPALLALAALAALIVAMARPQAVVAVPRDDATVVLTMDGSASMNATDVAPTRLDAAKSAASRFLDQLPDRFKVGLVSFSNATRVLEEPTDDREAVRSSLESIQGEVGTAIGDGIRDSIALAPRDENGQRSDKKLFAVLLLSDGTNTAGVDPLDVLDEAKEANVPIYTIALGTNAGTVEIPNEFGGGTQTVSVPPDPETLRRIAQETGGRFFAAPTQADLEAVYEEIGSQVSYEDEERELTAAFAGAGAFFLLVGASLSALWFGRIP